MDPIKVGDTFVNGRLVVLSVNPDGAAVAFTLLPGNGLEQALTLTPETALQPEAIPNFIHALGLD